MLIFKDWLEFSEKVSDFTSSTPPRGIDNEPVQEAGEAESIGRMGTLKEDTRDIEVIMEKIQRAN